MGKKYVSLFPSKRADNAQAEKLREEMRRLAMERKASMETAPIDSEDENALENPTSGDYNDDFFEQ